MFIKKYSDWKKITESISGFDRIYENDQDSPWPDWAGYTMDVLTSTEEYKRPNYKIILVNSSPICSIDEKRSTDEYDMIYVEFKGCAFEHFERGESRNIGPLENGPHVWYAKSTEPWYLYKVNHLPTAGQSIASLNESSKMYCSPNSNGGILVNAIKKVSTKGIKEHPNNISWNIGGDTLNWARNNKDIESLIWQSDSMKDHFLAWFAKQGKIDEFIKISNKTLKKNAGKYKIIIKNPGISIEKFGTDFNVEKEVDGQWKDYTPAMIETPEVVSESKIYESKYIVISNDDGKKKEKERVTRYKGKRTKRKFVSDDPLQREQDLGDPEKEFKGVIFQARDQFVLREDETQESERFLKWEKKQLEAGYRVRNKYNFSGDIRDKDKFYSCDIVLPEITVRRDKYGVIHVSGQKVKEVLNATKRTLLSINRGDEKTYRSNLEEEEDRWKLLRTLKSIYGEKRQVEGMKKRTQSDLKKRWEKCINDSKVIIPISIDYDNWYYKHSEKQRDKFTCISGFEASKGNRNSFILRYIKTDLYNRMKNRFYELAEWNYTQGYTHMSDIFGEVDNSVFGKSDDALFNRHLPCGRQAITDLINAYKKDLISEEDYTSFRNLLYRYDIEEHNAEIKRYNDDRDKQLADHRAKVRAESGPVLNAITDFVVGAVDAGKDAVDSTVEFGKGTAKLVGDIASTTGEYISDETELMWDYFKTSKVGKFVEENVADPVSSGVDIIVEEAKDFYINKVVTPLGIKLNVSVQDPKLSIINDFGKGKGGSATISIPTQLDIILKRKGKNAINSKSTDFNVSMTGEFDVDIKKKKIKFGNLNISSLDMGWVYVDVEDLLPGVPWLPELKFRLIKSGNNIFIEIKTGKDPIKGEGDDWWEQYDKLMNKIKEYTYQYDITSKILGFSRGITDSIKELDLMNIAGLK